MDLLIIILLTIITFPVVIFTEGILRIILGVIFVIVSPGYSLISALFPKKDSMSGIERIAFSLVLSFALVVLSGLALNYTPWGIRLTPIVVTITIIIVAMAGIAFIRRFRLAESERFSVSVKKLALYWRKGRMFNKLLVIFRFISIF